MKNTINTYLVPISSPYYYDFDYIIPIYARTQDKAYKTALSLPDTDYCLEGRLIQKPEYKYYPGKIKIKYRVYDKSEIHDTILIAKPESNWLSQN